MGRMPLSRRSLIDTNLMSGLFRPPSNVTECRDLRAKFLADLFNAAEKGRAISLVSPAGVEPWFDEASQVLLAMDGYQRVGAPLSGSSMLQASCLEMFLALIGLFQ